MKVLIAARALATAMLLAVSASSAMAAIEWDSTNDFTNPSTNPNGVWSYGYSSTYNGAVTFYDQATQFYTRTDEPSVGTSFFGFAGNQSDLTPGFYKVTSGNAYGVAAGEAALHGGANGEFAVLRFTAPTAGLFEINADWKPGNSGAADLYLLLNSVTLGYTPSTDLAGAFPTLILNLLAGDTISLVLGTSTDQYFSDSTPVNLHIESAVPEPMSVAVWGAIACLAGVFGYRRLA